MDIIDVVHQEALSKWKEGGMHGTIAGATGIGKTKIALDRIQELYTEFGDDLRVLVTVPTEKLRDVTWPEDAKKWNLETVYQTCVTGLCYVSLHKTAGKHYHLVVLDEAHHSTEHSDIALANCSYDELMALTATRPTQTSLSERTKFEILNRIAPVVFEYPIEQAIQDGIVSPFEVHVVELCLDKVTKNVLAGNAKKKWFTTEDEYYKFLMKQMSSLRMRISDARKDLAVAQLSNQPTTTIESELKQLEVRYSIATGKRARFIFNLPTKTRRAKDILQNILEQKPDDRTLLFCGSINQSKDICGTRVYNSKSDDLALEDFSKERISYLGVVNALNEGSNIPNLNNAIIVQASSVGRELVQRIGRTIRRRDGHEAMIIILMVKDTVDEKWVKEALQEIDQSRVQYYREQ